MEIIYRKIKPPPILENYVRYFWTMENFERPSPKTFRVFADGCPGLFFNKSEQDEIYQNNRKLLPSVFLYGQSTTHSELNSNGNLDVIGVCFYPNALKTIFGLDAVELTDSCEDLQKLSEKQNFCLHEKLFEAGSNKEKQIEIISTFLQLQISKNNLRRNEITHYAVSKIIASAGNISLRNLQKELQISERNLQRKFKEDVGVSPKLFSRIWRFQNVLERLQNQSDTTFADFAYEHEYADQSHFIREFREFTGFSPNRLQKSAEELGENLTLIKS